MGVTVQMAILLLIVGVLLGLLLSGFARQQLEVRSDALIEGAPSQFLIETVVASEPYWTWLNVARNSIFSLRQGLIDLIRFTVGLLVTGAVLGGILFLGISLYNSTFSSAGSASGSASSSARQVPSSSLWIMLALFGLGAALPYLFVKLFAGGFARRPVEESNRLSSSLPVRLVIVAAYEVFYSVTFALVVTLILGVQSLLIVRGILSVTIVSGTRDGVFAVLLVWYIGAAALAVFGLFYGLGASIQPVEVVSWSWLAMARNLAPRAVLGFLVMVVPTAIGFGVFGLISLVSAAVALNTTVSEDATTVKGFVVICLFGTLLGSALSGFSRDRLEENDRSSPNQGMRRSAVNALRIGIITYVAAFGFIWILTNLDLLEKPFGVDFNLRPELVTDINFYVAIGLLSLIPFLISGLLFGGLAVLKHIILRALLLRESVIPFNYASFLDSASERLFLRKIGGAYIFVHRILLNFLAESESGA
jgi:hypothetical protein